MLLRRVHWIRHLDSKVRAVLIHFDATCLCLSISRCIDAASLPGSRGTLRAATESQSSAHPPGCLVRPFRDCPGSCGTGYAVPPGTRRSASGGALSGLPSVVFRGSFVLACFASASPEALVLRTASQASSCIPALDVRKAHPLGSPSVATTRLPHGLVSEPWL